MFGEYSFVKDLVDLLELGVEEVFGSETLGDFFEVFFFRKFFIFINIIITGIIF